MIDVHVGRADTFHADEQLLRKQLLRQQSPTCANAYFEPLRHRVEREGLQGIRGSSAHAHAVALTMTVVGMWLQLCVGLAPLLA